MPLVVSHSPSRDRRNLDDESRMPGMEDRDLLGLVLAGIALMMFVTGIVLVV